ncbi:hypothetical protein [Microbispora sp. H10670]|uniref:hypothetical protein n=1 Tax=Microbispora sp. H10670 TaxID=2729108 RepID=UPI00160213A0|nr:hypothetical protein [Microbispora sp. H10670]
MAQQRLCVHHNGSRLFFGGEIAKVTLLERYRAEHPPVDLALLPVNGLRPLCGPPLVMGPDLTCYAPLVLVGVRLPRRSASW